MFLRKQHQNVIYLYAVVNFEHVKQVVIKLKGYIDELIAEYRGVKRKNEINELTYKKAKYIRKYNSKLKLIEYIINDTMVVVNSQSI